MVWRVILGLLVLVLNGVVGAWITQRVTEGLMPWWSTVVTAVVTAVVTGLLWGWGSPMFVGKLSVASVVFDVVYGFSFVMGFVMMGEKMSMLQFAGVLVSFLGIGIMSI